MKTLKSFWLVSGLVSILLVISSGCTNSVITEDTTSIPTGTNDVARVLWETYNNEELGFSIDKLAGTTLTENYDSTRKSVLFQYSTLEYMVYREEYPAQGATVNNGNFESFNFLDLEAIATEQIGDRTFRKFVSERGYCDGPSCSEPFVAFSTQWGKYVYTIQFNGDTTVREDEQYVLESLNIH